MTPRAISASLQVLEGRGLNCRLLVPDEPLNAGDVLRWPAYGITHEFTESEVTALNHGGVLTLHPVYSLRP